MVKLVCCDVDNTLLFDKNGTISHEVFDIIEKLSVQGVIFAAVSGRPLVDMVRLFAPVVNDIIIVAYDGAVVLYKGQLILDRPIEKNLYMAFTESFTGAELALNRGVEYILYTLADAYVLSESGSAAGGLKDSVTMVGRVNKILSPVEISEPVYKISLFSKASGTDFDYIVKDWSSYINNIYSGSSWCEFVSKGTDKGCAVNMIMERFGIKASEAMAIGDGENDISMLSSCGFSYAMESASETTKASASFITDDAARSIKEFFRI